MKAKKSLAILLSAILVLVLSSATVLANPSTNPSSSVTNSNQPKDTLSTPLPNIYGPETQQRVASSGKAQQPLTSYSIYLNVPKYNQNNYSDIMQTAGLTIANAGCLLTDCAATAYLYGQTSSTPPWLNTEMGNSACPLYWSALSDASGGYITGVDTNINNPTASQLCTIMFNAITNYNSPKPVLVSYYRTTSSHWLLVNALYGDGTHISDYGCIDPLDGNYHNLYDLINGHQLLQVAVLGRK